MAATARQTAGENITIHEFSHTVASAIGRSQGRNGDFWTKLRKAFADAKAPGGRLAVFNQNRPNPVYASTDEQEYWAEGAQAWFDHAVPSNSGGLSVRDDVKQKDPELAALLTEIYGDGPMEVSQDHGQKLRRHADAQPGRTGSPGRSGCSARPVPRLQQQKFASHHCPGTGNRSEGIRNIRRRHAAPHQRPGLCHPRHAAVCSLERLRKYYSHFGVRHLK